jgi:hypothetical protein
MNKRQRKKERRRITAWILNPTTKDGEAIRLSGLRRWVGAVLSGGPILIHDAVPIVIDPED